MHIGIAGPIATSDIAPLLDGESRDLPVGYVGAPFMSTLISELVGRGHFVSAFTFSTDIPLNSSPVIATGNNLKLYYIPMRPKAWPFNGWRFGRIVDLFSFERHRLYKAMVEASPEVIHAHWAYEFALSAMKTNFPCVVTSHDSPVQIAKLYRGASIRDYVYRWLRSRMALYVFKNAKRVTTVSPYMVNQIQCLSNVLIKMIPNPISNKVFEYRRRENSDPKKIIMVSNGWDTIKNPQVALKAFSTLSKIMPYIELHVYGKGYGENEEAHSWWKANEFPGEITFHGSVAYSEILNALSCSDLMVHTSLEESFGAVIAEAMAVGVPVVAGKYTGAVPWIVSEFGLLVDVTSDDEVSKAMQRLLSCPDLINEMGQKARDSIKSRFGVVKITDDYLTEYINSLSD